jgi:hypothetical protein
MPPSSAYLFVVPVGALPAAGLTTSLSVQNDSRIRDVFELAPEESSPLQRVHTFCEASDNGARMESIAP